jgi:hypothetical protein
MNCIIMLIILLLIFELIYAILLDAFTIANISGGNMLIRYRRLWVIIVKS